MDLLIKNFPYFMNVYFSISLRNALFTLVLCFVVLDIFMRKRARLAKTVLCSIYFTVLIIVTLLNNNRVGACGVILNPFYGLAQIIESGNIHFLRGMVSNIFLFIPFGLIIDWYFRIRSIMLKIVSIIGTSLVIELLQLGLCVGYFETEDIICNFIGGLIGLLVCYVIGNMKIVFLGRS